MLLQSLLIPLIALTSTSIHIPDSPISPTSHTSLPQYSFNYTYQMFVLTWPGTFCDSKSCKRQWTNNWNGRKFTVHGLWPNSNDRGFTDMISTGREDPGCTAPFRFNLGWFSQEQMRRLTEVMPELTQMNFWEHEWEKHGVCYLKLLNDKVNSGGKIKHSFAKQVYTKYWQEIISLYNQITGKFNLTKRQYENGDELARALGLDPASVRFSVERDSDLREILICTTLPNSLQANTRVIKCPRPSYYKRSISLPGFK